MPQRRSPRTRTARRAIRVTVTLARPSRARLVETLDGVADDRFEAPLRARADAGTTRTGALAEELQAARRGRGRRCGARPPRRASGSARSTSSARASRPRRTRRGAGSRARRAEPAEGDDRDELAERIERLERRRESLGQVNPLAKEEYDQEKERLVELSAQRADLEASLEELEKLRDDLARTVERALRGDVRVRAGELRRGRLDAVPGRRGPPASDRARGRGRAARASRSSSVPPARR